MKFFLFLIIIILTTNSLNSKDLFVTEFYKVEFISNNIEKEKIKRINEIKKDSFLNILHNTLVNEQFYFYQKDLSIDLINTLIKNIIIDDEKIIENKYLSKIKVNFDKKKIINFYRDQRIPYVEFFPRKFLLIIHEENDFYENLFTNNNNFYSYYNKNLLTNKLFKIPNLDINDRYILKKEDLKNRNINKIINFSNKYSLNDIIIVFAKTVSNKVQYHLILLSDGIIEEKKLNFYEYDFDKFFKLLEYESINIWKKINQIQNESTNFISCNINYFNILELKEIKNNLKNISIIKDFEIKSLAYQNILYDIYFYGNLKILTKIMEINKLRLINTENLCTITLK